MKKKKIDVGKGEDLPGRTISGEMNAAQES